jgi:hypothetical protein
MLMNIGADEGRDSVLDLRIFPICVHQAVYQCASGDKVQRYSFPALLCADMRAIQFMSACRKIVAYDVRERAKVQ